MLNCSNLENTVNYWSNLLKMKILQKTDKTVTLTFGENQAKLIFNDIGKIF